MQTNVFFAVATTKVGTLQKLTVNFAYLSTKTLSVGTHLKCLVVMCTHYYRNDPKFSDR